jgi:enoyl-CoA hydratase/carnithine racemase
MLDFQSEGAVAWAKLSRPEKLNAMTREFWGELREILNRVERDPELRVMVIYGEGSCFSVGGDIDGFGELTDAADRRDYVREALGALRAVETMPKPVIAAVHGAAFGGGCELTMVCDLLVADETARFATPEARVGLVPGLAMARGLAHVNVRSLKYMVFTGESMDAPEAKMAGLVNVVVPPGEHLKEAARLAELIARQAPLAIAVGKHILARDTNSGYAQSVDAVSFLQGTKDAAEGIEAFTQRREPRFEGR